MRTVIITELARAHIEDLHEADADGEDGLAGGRLDAREEVRHDAGDNRRLRNARAPRAAAAAAHGVGLAGARLAVSETAGVVAAEEARHQRAHALLVQERRVRAARAPVYGVVCERRPVLALHLHGAARRQGRVAACVRDPLATRHGLGNSCHSEVATMYCPPTP